MYAFKADEPERFILPSVHVFLWLIHGLCLDSFNSSMPLIVLSNWIGSFEYSGNDMSHLKLGVLC